MRSDLVRAAGCLAAALALPAFGLAEARSVTPVVAACANPKLPAEILDGPYAQDPGALPVVDAQVERTALRLAVAETIAQRDRGLMCVTRLRPQRGMVFVFPGSAQWEFWMKNTLVPLDMVWVDTDGTVTTVATAVPASTRTTPDSRIARRRGRGTFVIELPGGEAALDRIVVGAHVELPPLHAEQ